MINEKLKDKKLYISPAVEVMWIQSEGELMNPSVYGSGDDQEHGDNEDDDKFGNNSKANRFNFANILDSYDKSPEEPSSEFELPEF